MPELAAGALTFLRCDVSPARSGVLRSYSEQQVFDSYRLSQNDHPYFTTGFPLWKPLVDSSRIASLDDGATQKFSSDPQPAPIVSDTAQLTWSATRASTGQVIVDTTRTQEIIGFSNTQNKPPANFSADVTNSFSAILLTSLDARPIVQSGHLLLVAGAHAINTGMAWNSAHTGVDQWGSSPTLIEPVTGHIVLRGLDGATSVSAQPLDGAGQPLGQPIPATKDAGTWQIPIGTPATTWYSVTVER
jgi:hypothetical protein